MQSIKNNFGSGLYLILLIGACLAALLAFFRAQSPKESRLEEGVKEAAPSSSVPNIQAGHYREVVDTTKHAVKDFETIQFKHVNELENL